jgi:hypothetical protein
MAQPILPSPQAASGSLEVQEFVGIISEGSGGHECFKTTKPHA